MMLMPIGIINERHEPPIFYGVERPFIDTVIVPTTWFEIGAGVHGEIGRGWRYRAYVTAPLNAAEFNADEGIREGRQKGSESNVGRPAVTGRVEYVGYRGLTLGASAWSGRSGFEFRPRFDVPVSLAEADARYSRRGLELRGQFAQVWIDNADLLNDTLALRVGVNPNIGSALRGFSLEGSRRFFSGSRLGEVGGVRPLRKLRHAVPDAGRLRAAARVRSRCLGRRRQLLARPGRRREGGLLDRPAIRAR